MIVTSPIGELPAADAPTIDALFRRAAIRQPDALALCDPPDRATIDGKEPRTLTFTQTDNAVSALAAKLDRLQLGKDAVVAYQLANTVESVVTLLAILRAGLIAAPLPVLWRQPEILAALAASGATAIITANRIGETDHCALAMQAAAEHFPVRHVCVFATAADAPDGVVALDDIFTNANAMPPLVTRDDPPAAHAALITFENTADGIQPLVRNHAQILAADFNIAATTLLTPIALTSFAGIALAVVPWLKSGCRLALHQPFDAKLFAAQRKQYQTDVAIVPGVTACILAQSKALAEGSGLKTVVALWRSPEQWRAAERWTSPLRIADYLAIDEFGIVPLGRDEHGAPLALSLHSLETADGFHIAERGGNVHIGGAMVPQPWLLADNTNTSNGTDGMLKTSLRCQSAGDGLQLASHQGDLARCGGYRLHTRRLTETVAAIDPDACVAALPHRLLGDRIAVMTGQHAAIEALRQTLSPLLAAHKAA